MRHRVLLPVVALLAPFAASAVPVDPIAFFAGKSAGQGNLKKAFSAARPVTVASEGRVEPDGTLVIQQRVVGVEDKPINRVWRLRREGDRIAGSISDATSPVVGEITGNRIHLTYTIRGGLAADQWIDIALDGRSAHDRVVIKKFGITFATMDETIRRAE